MARSARTLGIMLLGPSVTIVCVFNDPSVRERCLDRSIESIRWEMPDVDYITVDNTRNTYSSAGAALTYGASKARHDFVVFAHQDVYFHSLRQLARAAQFMAADPSIGILGAIGVSTDGRLLGQLRDRVVLLGDSISNPSTVDSVDEVLFMVRKSALTQEPLTSRPDLSWHAYAVEYCLRMRERGLRAVALDLLITHNSLTINLTGLDAAHGAVSSLYPHFLPIMTTCGPILSPAPRVTSSWLDSHRWRYRWLIQSWRIARTQLRSSAITVLADIRRDVDDLLDGLDEPLLIINADPSGTFASHASGMLMLQRRTNVIEIAALSPSELLARARVENPFRTVLFTNLGPQDLAPLLALMRDRRPVVGFHDDMSPWLLVGSRDVPSQWSGHRARPLGARALHHDAAKSG